MTSQEREFNVMDKEELQQLARDLQKQLARIEEENVELQKDCPKVCKSDKYKQALDEIAERENSVCDACKKSLLQTEQAI